MLNFRLNRDVDALCRHLADNPDVPIARVTVALRALLAGRLLLFLANSVEEPDAEIVASEGPMSDEDIRAAVWNLLAKARLPSKWDGKPFDRGRADIMPLADPWFYWPRSPPDPELWTVVEFVQGDEEWPSDDPPMKVATSDMRDQEAAGRLMVRVWWRPVPW